MTLRALDLFCGAGGAAMGYHLAGFDVVGVDLRPQPRYPFTFIQADALTFPLDGFDLIHASPPCQGYSIMRNLPWLRDREYPLLIAPVRERLQAQYVKDGTHWIIENVMGAVTAGAIRGGWLCGGMFGLPFYRHRVFETSFPWMAPGHPRHRAVILSGGMLAGRQRAATFRPDGTRGTLGNCTGGHRSKAELATMAVGLGIDWMTRDGLSQAIPPAYSRYLAEAFLAWRGSVAMEVGA